MLFKLSSRFSDVTSHVPNKLSALTFVFTVTYWMSTYHPELHNKCESWFMDQKLSKGTEHVTNIRAFSKLISIIPLSDALCYKILAGKVVRDACLTWIKDTLLKSPQDLGKNLSSRSFELLHRFILEEFSNIDLEPYFCDGFASFETDDVKRIWVKYIQPKLGLFNTGMMLYFVCSVWFISLILMEKPSSL